MIKKDYRASLCRGGVLGGALRVTEEEIVFRTQKVSVERKFRHLCLPIHEIAEIRKDASIFPTATIAMRSGETHRFLVFSRRKFLEAAREIGVSVTA